MSLSRWGLTAIFLSFPPIARSVAEGTIAVSAAEICWYLLWNDRTSSPDSMASCSTSVSCWEDSSGKMTGVSGSPSRSTALSIDFAGKVPITVNFVPHNWTVSLLFAETPKVLAISSSRMITCLSPDVNHLPTDKIRSNPVTSFSSGLNPIRPCSSVSVLAFLTGTCIDLVGWTASSQTLGAGVEVARILAVSMSVAWPGRLLQFTFFSNKPW